MPLQLLRQRASRARLCYCAWQQSSGLLTKTHFVKPKFRNFQAGNTSSERLANHVDFDDTLNLSQDVND